MCFSDFCHFNIVCTTYIVHMNKYFYGKTALVDKFNASFKGKHLFSVTQEIIIGKGIFIMNIVYI